MPEVNIFPLKTTLVGAISSTTRPVTFTVAATDSHLGAAGATFSVLIYDAGTDANPTNAEALEITAGGAGTSWTGTTEDGSTAHTHANGSTVLATVITPRSLSQPMNDHTSSTTTPDPHSMYMRKSSFLGKGDILVGTGNGTFSRFPAPTTNGAPLVSDSTQTFGMKWSGGGAAANTVLTSAALSATASLSAVPGGALLSAVASITTTTQGTVGAAATQIATISADGLSSITFNGIGTYNNLRLTGMARSSANVLLDTLLVQFNGDANKSYSTEGLTVSDGISTPSLVDSQATAMTVADVPGAQAAIGASVRFKADIPHPSGSVYAKGLMAQSVCLAYSSGIPVLELVMRGGIWKPRQQTPITSITISLATGPFSTGSTFMLVGEV